jgi:hypothetical protein
MASRPPDGDQESGSDRNAQNVPGATRTKAPGAPSAPTTVGEQLDWATRVLESVEAREPAREAVALLASVMASPSVALEPDSAATLTASEVDRFLAAIVRRTREEPSQS